MKFLLILIFFTSFLFSQEEFNVTYFEDSSAKQSINQIEENGSLLFKPLEKSNFGSTESNIWLKIVFTNHTNETKKKILEFQDSRLDRLELYHNTRLVNVIGDRLPFNNRKIKSSTPTYSFTVAANSQTIYYICISNKGTTNLRYKTYSETDYSSHINMQNIFYSFYYGATSIMIFYNLILFIFIRERAFFDYVVYHLSLVGVMLYYNGVIMGFYEPSLSDLNLGNVPIYLASFTTLMASQFARSYLQTKQSVVRLDKYILVMIAINIVSIFLSIFDVAYAFNHLFSSIIMVVQSIFLFYISIYLIIILKSQSAKFYFVGWGVMLLSVIMIGLVSVGVVPRNTLTSNIFQISSLFELLLLSMGLAFRYSEQQKTISLHEQELRTINQNLEKTITTRTQELAKEVIQTKSLLKDRDILFKELYHRVKNNLQMMVSILAMQKRRVEDIKTKEILDDVTGRIKSLALIHEKLQTSNELDHIDMQEYLSSLLHEIKRSYQFTAIQLKIECENIYMSIDLVTSIGLIVNELTSNSFKHAFKNQEHPKITLILYEDAGEYKLTYSDNGEGSKKIDSSKSLGTLLVDTLTKSQLKGQIFVQTEPSISYNINFPKLIN